MSEGLRFPFDISARGVAASSPRERQIYEQLEQMLLTLPGERVNRPTFGCGVQRLVFASASEEARAAAEYTISVAIRRHFEDILLLDAVRVTVHDSSMYIDILYTLRASGEELKASFQQPLLEHA
jgi:phage baseplate assembly protein W